jgi:hypothetical protein
MWSYAIDSARQRPTGFRRLLGIARDAICVSLEAGSQIEQQDGLISVLGPTLFSRLAPPVDLVSSRFTRRWLLCLPYHLIHTRATYLKLHPRRALYAYHMT